MRRKLQAFGVSSIAGWVLLTVTAVTKRSGQEMRAWVLLTVSAVKKSFAHKLLQQIP